MTSTAKTTLAIIIAVIVVIALFFAFRDKVLPQNADNSSATTTTSNTDVTNTPGISGSVSGAGANVTAATSLVNNTQALNTLLDSVIVRVPNTTSDVRLVGGKADFTDGSRKGQVTRGAVIGKIQTEDGYDVFTDMTISMTNVTGTMHYVALFQVTGSSLTFTSAVVVGDRVLPQSVTAKAITSATVTPPQVIMNSKTGYILSINYLDRKSGEAMTAAPSVPKILQAQVRNHLVTR